MLKKIFIFIAIPGIIFASWDDTPACFRELETTFFQPQIVSKALTLHNVYQNQWDLINRRLRDRSQDVPRILRERAERSRPNPLQYPFQAKEADELLTQILFEIFVSVMYESNVATQSDLRGMFNYIRREQAARIRACYGIEPGR